MEDFFLNNGYPLLLAVSFLAATVVPFGSEWLVTAMLLQGFSPVSVVLVATAGNYLGGCTTYMIGLSGGPFLIEKVLGIQEKSRRRAERFFERYGSWSLFFSWVPVVGDPLCLVGGLLKVSFVRFSILVILGKLVRYATLAFLVTQGLQGRII